MQDNVPDHSADIDRMFYADNPAEFVKHWLTEHIGTRDQIAETVAQKMRLTLTRDLSEEVAAEAARYGEYRQSYNFGPGSPLRWEWTPHFDGSILLRLFDMRLAAPAQEWRFAPEYPLSFDTKAEADQTEAEEALFEVEPDDAG